MGDAVVVACFCVFWGGDVTFVASPGMVAPAVAAAMVAETPRESAVEATVVERVVAMPLLFKIVLWVVAA